MRVYELVSRAIRLLAEEYSSGDSEEENKIYVTELAGCLRKAYYDRVSPLRSVPELALMAAAGHGVHMWLETKICQVCEEMGGECFMEGGVFSSIYSEYGVIVVAGVIDVLCKLNRSIVIEIKTSNNSNMDVRKDWARQVRYYAAIVDADEAYLLVVSRSNGMWKLKKVAIGDKDRVIREMESRAIELWRALMEKKPPEKERGPWCRYCPYKWKCYGNAHA